MSESLENTQVIGAESVTAQPHMQRDAPDSTGGVNAGFTAESDWQCPARFKGRRKPDKSGWMPGRVCGSPIDPQVPTKCTSGHVRAGNQLGRVHEDERPEVLEDMPVQSTTSIDVLDRQVARIQRRIEHREGRLRMALSASKRERLEKVQAADESALVAALQLRDKLQREGRTATSNRTNNILAQLSDEQLETLLGWLGCKSLEDVPDFDGPLPLRIELTHRPETEQSAAAREASSAQSEREAAERRSAEVLERVRADLGEVAGPVLVRGNRQTDPAGETFGPEKFVFGDAVGNQVGDIKRAWETCVLKAHGHKASYTKTNALSEASRQAHEAIDLTFHDLRHETGSRLLEAGWPLHNVSHMLGHANIAQTSTYLNATKVGLQDAMRRLDASRCNPVAKQAETEHPPVRNEGEAEKPQQLVN
jgi:integrase-like protein